MRLTPVRFRLLVLLASVPMAGCKLVDQRTFVAHADAPPVVHVPAGKPVAATPPLLAIRFPAASDQWAGPLKVAVALATSRKPDVLFTVESVVPARGAPSEQAARLSRATSDAEAVADAIVGYGVDPLQVQLTAATGAGVPDEEIRVYVR